MKTTIQFFAFCFLLLIYSCATIVMPSGGLKDLSAPVVVRSYPENNTLRFYDDKLSLYFDEYVELNQPQNNILISPFSIEKPIINIVGKKMNLEFKSGFKPNTTYRLDFVNAIKDYNEGNLLPNYSLIFSTGDILDSGRLRVNVRDAKTSKINDLTRVCLVRKKSDFFGKNYSYMSGLQNGSAQFNTLSKGKYFVYAFADSNKNMIWEKTEPMAFYKDEISQDNKEVNLRLFPTKRAGIDFTVQALSPTEFRINTSQEIAAPEVNDSVAALYVLSPTHFLLITRNSGFKQSIRFKYDLDKWETIVLPIEKTTKYIEQLSLSNDRNAGLVRNDTFWIDFNSFISRHEKSKLLLKQDEKTINANYIVDKNRLGITDLLAGKNYRLAIDSQALWQGPRYNKSLLITFQTYPLENIHNNIVLTLDPKIASNKQLKIYLIENNKWLALRKEAKISLNKIYGNEIMIGILEDLNNDGIWTTGDIEKEIQPEQLYMETIKLETKKADYILKITSP